MSCSVGKSPWREAALNLPSHSQEENIICSSPVSINNISKAKISPDLEFCLTKLLGPGTFGSENMMGGMSYPAMAAPMAVISPQFCVGYPVDLTIVRKLMTLSEGSFGVADVNGNILFTIKGKIFSLHDRRVLLDAAGNPLITFQQKLITAHRRWNVFKGESTSDKDLLFSVKKSSLLQFKTKLDVFFAANTAEDVCDFKIEGSWFERSCVIYAGNTNNIVAQMHKKHTAQSILLGKDTFGVTVYPNVDYAFIVSLVAILEEINADRSGED